MKRKFIFESLLIITLCFSPLSKISAGPGHLEEKMHSHHNRLFKEKSPYLLQHATNPVDWYPWGEEAFEKARKENKLIFLSIGYSTCHWCHVMEKESFEDQDVAEVLNASYVSIKVDREERPDIDQVYMNVAMALHGSGGWPLTIVMTPLKVPFFAATYLPKRSRYGMSGIMEVLTEVAKLWRDDPGRLSSAGKRIVSELGKALASSPGDELIKSSIFSRAAEELESRYDADHGGFGEAPKFPQPHQITFLLRRYRRSGNPEYLQMAEATLKAMRRGGIYDQIGFGFHRYSTDARWLVPHFEKMLYDQAGLSVAYMEGFLATGKKEYADTAREIFDFMMRDMTDERGGFFTAIDADSEGEEGQFYIWTKKEILDLLGKEDGEFFSTVFSVEDKGNYIDEASGRATGKNIPHFAQPPGKRAKALGIGLETFKEKVEKIRLILLEKRNIRVHPHLDDKIITGLNGLMISAMSRGGRFLGENKYIEAAKRSADFILETLLLDKGGLLRRYRDGEAGIEAFADDYAFFSRALLDLYQADFQTRYLKKAMELAETLYERFFDQKEKKLYDSAHDGEKLFMRPWNIYDGAIPSASSAALEVFAKLYLITGNDVWRKRADSIMKGASKQVDRVPSGYVSMLQGAALLLEPSREIIIIGGKGVKGERELLNTINESFLPESVLIFISEKNRENAEKLIPFVRWMDPVDGAAAAYVCQNFTCKNPLTDRSELKRAIANPP